MGRYRYVNVVVAGVAFSVLVADAVRAQPAVPAPAPAQPNAPAVNAAPNAVRPDVSRRQGIEQWRSMSPEDRQRFQSNIERWRQMPPEERRELREREGWRQERLKREAEAAARAAGLQLEAERRQQFELRYIQERKRIEQELRRELREKRERELAPVVEQLKKEFTQPSGSATPGASSPAASSPRK